MMRKIVIALAVVMLAGFTAAQPQQSQGIMNPGQKPGDLLYGLDRASESMARAVASAPIIGSDELKSKVMANQAEERLSEARTLAEQNRSDKAAELMEDYQNTLNKSIRYSKDANNTKLNDRLENVTSKHVNVLQDVQQKVPEQAQKGIQTAIESAEKSRQGLEKAREARERSNSMNPGSQKGQGIITEPGPRANSGERDNGPDKGVQKNLSPDNAVNNTLENPEGSSKTGNDSVPDQNSSSSPDNSATGDFTSKPDREVPGFGR